MQSIPPTVKMILRTCKGNFLVLIFNTLFFIKNGIKKKSPKQLLMKTTNEVGMSAFNCFAKDIEILKDRAANVAKIAPLILELDDKYIRKIILTNNFNYLLIQ